MDDQDRPPVGTVAEEAARLLEALGGLASTASTKGYAESATGSAASTEPGDHGEHGATAEGSSHGAESRCEHCGAANSTGQAVVCQLCPVCQGLGLLRALRPETVDRLADLAGAVAMTLRDLAAQRREAPSGSGTAPATRANRVEDIPVEDEQGSVGP